MKFTTVRSNYNIFLGSLAALILFCCFNILQELTEYDRCSPSVNGIVSDSVRTSTHLRYHRPFANREQYTTRTHSRDEKTPLTAPSSSRLAYESHIMCACGRCYDVLCSINKTGYLSVEVTKVFEGGWSLSRHIGDDVSYFHVMVIGEHGLAATIVSDLDTRLGALTPLRAVSSSAYNITLTLIHANLSSAYGLDHPQGRELECPLCLINSTCQLSVIAGPRDTHAEARRTFRWIPSRGNSSDTRACVPHGNACYHFSRDDISDTWDGQPWHPTPSDEECFRRKKFFFSGDSHSRGVEEFLAPWVGQTGWQWVDDGKGILHNSAPHGNVTAYVAGDTAPVFIEGDMRRRLRGGDYQKEQDRGSFDGWIFTSGHWDIRDVPVDVYLARLRVLFVELDLFRRENENLPLFWFGVPPFSHRYLRWGGRERRTNVKLALADAGARKLCAEFDIRYIPFFDIALPFYTRTCDTLHYLCHGQAEGNTVGEAQLRVLLSTICT